MSILHPVFLWTSMVFTFSRKFLEDVLLTDAIKLYTCLYLQLHTCGCMMAWDLFCSVINFHNIPLPLHRRVLQCCTPVSAHLPWSSSESQWLDSLLSPYRANVTMLQDSLYVTDCYFAPVSRRHTSLQHNRLPKSIGDLLQGSLAITLTRLSLASW